MKTLLLISAFIFSAIVCNAQDKPEGLFINSKAYDFKAKDQSGIEVSMKELRRKGNVVVVFYRGYWCPYCNKYLKRLQDSLSLITAKGASIVAITPETGQWIDTSLAKTGAVFPVISDKDMKIASAYKVSFRVDERTLGRYKNSGVDLLQTNGQKVDAYLPVPAVYIVNKDGQVVFRYFDEDYKRRIPVKDIIAAL